MAFYLQTRIKNVVSEKQIPTQVFQEMHDPSNLPIPNFIADAQQCYENDKRNAMNVDPKIPEIDDIAKITGNVMQDITTGQYADVVLAGVELSINGQPLSRIENMDCVKLDSIRPIQTMKRIQVIEKTVQGTSVTPTQPVVYTLVQRTATDLSKNSSNDTIELMDYRVLF